MASKVKGLRSEVTFCYAEKCMSQLNRIFTRCGFGLLALSVMLAFSACTKTPSVPSTRNVDVEVFVVTKGSQNIKLGLVQVSATPMESMVAALTPVCDERNAKISTVEELIRKAEKELASINATDSAANEEKLRATLKIGEVRSVLEKALKDASIAAESYEEQVRVRLSSSQSLRDDQWEGFRRNLAARDLATMFISSLDEGKNDKVFESVKEILGREVWKGLSGHRDVVLAQITQYEMARRAHLDSTRESAARRKEFKESKSRVEFLRETQSNLGNPATLFSKLPEPQTVAKTNADGKCTITLPRGGNWVLTARASRTVSKEDDETYFWLVAIPQDATQIMLSNDNVLKPFEDPLARMK